MTLRKVNTRVSPYSVESERATRKGQKIFKNEKEAMENKNLKDV